MLVWFIAVTLTLAIGAGLWNVIDILSTSLKFLFIISVPALFTLVISIVAYKDRHCDGCSLKQACPRFAQGYKWSFTQCVLWPSLLNIKKVFSGFV